MPRICTEEIAEYSKGYAMDSQGKARLKGAKCDKPEKQRREAIVKVMGG